MSAVREEPWEVFARQDATIPVRHIGRVDAATLDDAVVFARTLYQEWKWLDMFIVHIGNDADNPPGLGIQSDELRDTVRPHQVAIDRILSGE